QTDRGAGTVRPRDPRQKNRKPGTVHEKPPAFVQAGGTIERFGWPAILRFCARLFEATAPEAEGVAKNDGCAAKDLSSFLSQAKGYRRICAPGGRGAPQLALSTDGAGQKPTQQKEAVATSEQNPRVG